MRMDTSTRTIVYEDMYFTIIAKDGEKLDVRFSLAAWERFVESDGRFLSELMEISQREINRLHHEHREGLI